MEIHAKIRTTLGKTVRVLRKTGELPAVLYGEGVPSQSITVLRKDFEKIYRVAGESTLLALDLEGKVYNVLIYDIMHDPLRGTPLHADFYAVRMDKMIRTKVPIEFLGDSLAVKNEGGIPVKVMQEIEVEALPKDLPHALCADLSSLGSLGAKLFVRDLILPPGVKVLAEEEEIIFLIEAPRSDAELAALKEAPVVEGPVEVKTEQEVKRETKEVSGEEVSAEEETR